MILPISNFRQNNIRFKAENNINKEDTKKIAYLCNIYNKEFETLYSPETLIKIKRNKLTELSTDIIKTPPLLLTAKTCATGAARSQSIKDSPKRSRITDCSTRLYLKRQSFLPQSDTRFAAAE